MRTTNCKFASCYASPMWFSWLITRVELRANAALLSITAYTWPTHSQVQGRLPSQPCLPAEKKRVRRKRETQCRIQLAIGQRRKKQRSDSQCQNECGIVRLLGGPTFNRLLYNRWMNWAIYRSHAWFPHITDCIIGHLWCADNVSIVKIAILAIFGELILWAFWRFG